MRAIVLVQVEHFSGLININGGTSVDIFLALVEWNRVFGEQILISLDAGFFDGQAPKLKTNWS